MTVSKRVAKSGAVTLPRQLRQETGILPGVPVDIEADEDGVHIRKHVTSIRKKAKEWRDRLCGM